MAIACIFITHLPLKVELLRAPVLVGQPVVIYRQAQSQRVVLDYSPEAHEVAAGMALEEALARCPYASLVEANEGAYREVWEGVLSALEERSPVMEDAGLGIAYTDLVGLELLYQDEPRLIAALLGACPQAYRPRVGVATGKFPAYIAALQAQANSAKRAPSDIRAFLAPLPVLYLPTSWEIQERLLGFGLERIGNLAELPFDALQAQFGPEGAKLWRLANGIDTDRVMARLHRQSLSVGMALATPTASLPAILVALESLLLKSFGGLRGRFARAAVLEGEVAHRPPWLKRLVFKEAVGDPQRAFRLLRDRLANLTLPGPLETLGLTLTEITGERGRQESLFRDVRNKESLDEAIRQVRIQLGVPPPIYHIRELEPWSRIPERRHALVRYEP